MTTTVPSRREQIRRFLEENKLEAWIAWRPDELLMLSGYFPFWGASFLLCFLDAEPILYVPQIELREQIPHGLQVRDYPWGDLKCADPYGVLISEIGKELAKRGISTDRVGMVANGVRNSLPIQAGEQIPIPENFSSQLAAITAQPDGKRAAEFAALYLRKTPDEVQAIRRANRVANIGLRAFEENCMPGTTEAEVSAAVESAIYRQVGKDGTFHSKGWAVVQSGPNSADAGRFNRSTGRQMQEGDLAVIELATCVNGYFSDLTRTVSVGKPTSEAAEIFALVKEAQQATVDALRPGVAAGDIDAIARDRIAAAGLGSFFTHHTGHHVGFRYHDPGFLIFPGEQSKLQPGMVVTIEPGVYVPDRGAGARIEDDVLITDSGHEILSKADA